MTIWKFVLEVAETQIIAMPGGALILSVANQDGSLCLWAMVDPEAPSVARRFAVAGTGHPIPENFGRFIGTVLMSPFVWHVFEENCTCVDSGLSL